MLAASALCISLQVAGTGSGQALPATLDLRVAMPDSVVGKSDGVIVRAIIVSSLGEEQAFEEPVQPGGWKVLSGDCELPAGEPHTVRVVVNPGKSPAFDALGFHSLTVSPRLDRRPENGPTPRNLIATASEPYVLLNGEPAPYRAQVVGGSVLIEGQPRTPLLLVHDPFDGKPCEMIVEFDGAPFFPDLVNHARGAALRASSTWTEGYRLEGLNDGRLDLALEAGWTDATPDDFPDWVELHFPYRDPVPVSHVLVFMKSQIDRSMAITRAELQGLSASGWARLETDSDPDVGFIEWRLEKPRELAALRLIVQEARRYASRILEVEAWGPPTDERPLDLGDCLSVSPGRPVFANGQQAEARAVVHNPLPDAARLFIKSSVETRTGKPIVDLKQQSVSVRAGGESSSTISLGTLPGGVHHLRVGLYAGQRLLAERLTEIAVKSALGPLRSPDLSEVRPIDPRAGIVSQVAISLGGGYSGNKSFESARAAGCDLVTPVAYLKDLEPHEHCYALESYPELIERARQHGTGLEILVCMIDNQIPEWLAGHEIKDSLGRSIALHAGKGDGGKTPSYWSPLFREHWQRLVSEIVTHFGQNDEIKLWHFRPGDLDVFYHDIPRQKRIYDYSEFARRKFIEYVRDVRGYSLAQANGRYGLDLAQWDDLRLPEPDFEAEADLRPYWADFIDFKQWTIDELLELTFSTVRQHDTKRPLCQWGLGGSGALDFVLEKCRQHGALCSFNSIENQYNGIWLDLARRHGTLIRTETGRIPPTTRNFGQSVFNALAGGANMYVWVGQVDPENPAWQTFGRSTDLFRELSGAQPERRDVGALFSYTYYRQKTFQWTVFSSLLKPEVNLLLAADRRGMTSLDWFSDYSPLENLDRYKLIIDSNSPVLPTTVIKALAEYVKHGGVLLLFPESGRYERAHPEAESPLLKALGGRLDAHPDELLGIVRWQHGEGTALLVTRPPNDLEEMGRLLQEVQAPLGIEGRVRVPEPIWPSTIVKNGRRFVLLYNDSDDEQRFTVQVQDADPNAATFRTPETEAEAVTGSPPRDAYTTFEVSLAARQLGVLELGPA